LIGEEHNNWKIFTNIYIILKEILKHKKIEYHTEYPTKNFEDLVKKTESNIEVAIRMRERQRLPQFKEYLTQTVNSLQKLKEIYKKLSKLIKENKIIVKSFSPDFDVPVFLPELNAIYFELFLRNHSGGDALIQTGWLHASYFKQRLRKEFPDKKIVVINMIWERERIKAQGNLPWIDYYVWNCIEKFPIF